MSETQSTVQLYDKKYNEGYGLVYPDGHIIRTYQHVLKWELGLTTGRIFDFGCGTGAHLKYFADQSFIPHGCDTSATAIAACRRLMPEHAANLHVSQPWPDMAEFFQGRTFDVFLSNQALYFLEDKGIRHLLAQAAQAMRPGGVLIASMMAYTHWYGRLIAGRQGDFKRVEITGPRLNQTMFINFKDRDQLPALFAPFKPLHLGFYSHQIRSDEGPGDHWLFIGLRP
jgi:SAM-dependent methyltransferase